MNVRAISYDGGKSYAEVSNLTLAQLRSKPDPKCCERCGHELPEDPAASVATWDFAICESDDGKQTGFAQRTEDMNAAQLEIAECYVKEKGWT